MFICVFTKWVVEFWNKAKSFTSIRQKCQKLCKIFLSGATECEIDKQGRFLIPTNLREAANLSKEAVIIGVGTRLEIWDKEKWAKCDEEISADEIAENMTMLGI